jgi:hypothetical protein
VFLREEHVKPEYTVPVANRYARLRDQEVEARRQDTEVCFAAQVVKNISADSEYWALDKEKNVCILTRSKKPVIILKHNENVWKALVDTGAERCIINYTQFKCLKNEQIVGTNVRLKGITGTTNRVCGEVELELALSPGNKIKVDALILKDTDMGYDLILCRDLQQEADVNLKEGSLTLQGEKIRFMDRIDHVSTHMSGTFDAEK